jgi:hypothetical protein
MSAKTRVPHWLCRRLHSLMPAISVVFGTVRPGLLRSPVWVPAPGRLRRDARLLVGTVALALGASGGLVATNAGAAFAGSGAPTTWTNSRAPGGAVIYRIGPGFPEANVTYPNGAIVEFYGTYYLFAGGHAFGVPTLSVLASLQSVDRATIVPAVSDAAVAPAGAPRPGTLVIVYNNPTLYVAGNDGQLHSFSSPGQLLAEGYDPLLVVTVPNFGGLTVGSPVDAEPRALNAVSTSADGAIADSSGSYYVFDGGKAFSIPTVAALSVVQKSDPATALEGTVGAAQTGAPFATGALVTVDGVPYVGYAGELYAFQSAAQYDADGYGGTPSVVVPNFGGLTVVSD